MLFQRWLNASTCPLLHVQAVSIPNACHVSVALLYSVDQRGKVANPVRGQLNKENKYFPVRVRA